MASNIVVLKQDVLSELRNKKYYVQNELERVAVKVSESDISHKERVSQVVYLVQELALIDQSIALVNAVFPAQEVNSEAPAKVDSSVAGAAPATPAATNVVEAQDKE